MCVCGNGFFFSPLHRLMILGCSHEKSALRSVSAFSSFEITRMFCMVYFSKAVCSLVFGALGEGEVLLMMAAESVVCLLEVV